MDRISDKRKCMASLAVFRDLYNTKRDIYSVIAEFAKLALAEKALSSFNLQLIIYFYIKIIYYICAKV